MLYFGQLIAGTKIAEGMGIALTHNNVILEGYWKDQQIGYQKHICGLESSSPPSPRMQGKGRELYSNGETSTCKSFPFSY